MRVYWRPKLLHSNESRSIKRGSEEKKLYVDKIPDVSCAPISAL